MRTCILMVAACLLLPFVAIAQEQQDDEALWLAYAPLLERALEQIGSGSVEGEAAYHSGAWLDGLAAEFGDKPAFWQLRWWHTTTSREGRDDLISESSRAGTLFTGEIAPEDWLRQAKARGAVDFTTAALLYQVEAGDLQRLWYRLRNDEATAEDLAYLAGFGFPDKPWIAMEEAEAALIDTLVVNYSEESWPHYERAMLHFLYGEWEDGLAALEAGNHAPSNRAPQAFPRRYVQAQFSAGRPLALEIAAGAVWQLDSFVPLPNYIRISEHSKSQMVRWALGAPISELGPWHRYLCRLGVTKGSVGQHSIVAAVMHDRLLRFWLLESPEALELEQREALFTLNRKLQEPRNIHRNRSGIFEEWLVTAGKAVVDPSVHRDNYAYALQEHALQRKAASFFEEAYNFDFDTFSYLDAPSAAE